MFTPEERSRLREALLATARADKRITGAAITGSAAESREDSWSDVDLAFGVEAAELPGVMQDWTARMYEQYSAVHHVDVTAGDWIYRVFLLPGTLQVDLAFAPQEEFRALAPTFRLVFGKANEPRHHRVSRPDELIGLGWLYALHARTCIARGKLWQAEYMISGARDHALALACLRHGRPVFHARGIDDLPRETVSRFENTLICQLDAQELARAFKAVLDELLIEVRTADGELADRLEPSLRSLAEDVAGNL